jgi:hypothetical protein
MLKRQRLGDDPSGIRSVQVAMASFTAESTTNAQIFAVPKDTLIVDVIGRVITAFGSGATVDVGDSADYDGYINATQMADTVTGYKRMLDDSTHAYVGGKYYEADDTINIWLDPNSSTAGTADVYCFYVPALA